MTQHTFDVIVVGARCAGAPTAMLLARKGYKVLVVDRATFPSDTISTHVIHPPGIAALERWGVLDRVLASGCPPMHTYAFDFGPFTIAGAPGFDGCPGYAPRRILLDKILVDAAAEAGAEVREGFAVEDVVVEDGVVTGIRGHVKDGPTVTETARVVIGADGRNSVIAKAVSPEQYNEKAPLLSGYYAYWSGLPMNGRFETYIRERRGFAALPTNDNLTLVIAGWPFAEFEANKDDLEGNYRKTFELCPAFADRIRGARLESKLFGAAVPNFFRKPYGPGWALVGDAGYTKDPITAQGMLDAFLDAEVITGALHDFLANRSPFATALGAYQAARDARVLPMYEFTTQLATLEPPPPQMQQVLGAVAATQDAMDGFCRMNASATPIPEFFSDANLGKIFAAAANQPH
jgi:2-polyprenyl-6-methoxyphenol hydroxylase-like FAD-dependent oxidoreductase